VSRRKKATDEVITSADATDPETESTNDSAWRARLAKMRSAYQSQLEKSQANYAYEFVPYPTYVSADEGYIVDSGIGVAAQERLPEEVDVTTKVDIQKQQDHVVPMWLRTVAGYSWRLLLVAASIALIVWGMSHVRMVIISIFIALVLTSALRPLRNIYDRHMKRGLAVLCTMVTGILIVGALLTFVVMSVAGSWASLGAEFSNGVERLLELLQGAPFHLHLPFEHVSDALTAGQGWVAGHYSELISRAGALVEWIVYLALAIFLTVFFLSSGREMWQWILSQFPVKTRANWTKAFSAGFTTFAGYARGLVIIGLIDGILAAILLFALGIPLAAPLAVLVFIGSFIEMIGAPAAMVIAGVVALATRGPIRALLVILGVALIGQIEGHLLQPFIMGRQVKLHPVVIALAVATGTVLAGIMGAILTVPIVAVAWSIYKALRPQPDDPAASGKQQKAELSAQVSTSVSASQPA